MKLSLEQLSNAPLPIEVTDEGMWISKRDEPENAPLPIEVTDKGIST